MVIIKTQDRDFNMRARYLQMQTFQIVPAAIIIKQGR
jgi:hypothetical protein